MLQLSPVFIILWTPAPNPFPFTDNGQIGHAREDLLGHSVQIHAKIQLYQFTKNVKTWKKSSFWPYFPLQLSTVTPSGGKKTKLNADVVSPLSFEQTYTAQTSSRLIALSAISSLLDNGRSATAMTGWLCCKTAAICTSKSDRGCRQNNNVNSSVTSVILLQLFKHYVCGTGRT